MKTLIALTAGLLLLGSAVAVAGQARKSGPVWTRQGRRCAELPRGRRYDQNKRGASEWGMTAGERAGDNGHINRDYRDAVGGSPTKGNDK